MSGSTRGPETNGSLKTLVPEHFEQIVVLRGEISKSQCNSRVLSFLKGLTKNNATIHCSKQCCKKLFVYTCQLVGCKFGRVWTHRERVQSADAVAEGCCLQ